MVQDRSAILRVRFNGPYVVLQLTDSRGARLRVHESWRNWPASGGSSGAAIAQRCTLLAADLPPARFGSHDTGPVPLALFVDVPPYLRLASDSDPIVVSLLSTIAGSVGADRVQFVTFTGARDRVRTGFSLPFDVLAVGPQAKTDIADCKAQWWTQVGAVEEAGFRIAEVDSNRADLEAALRERERDIVVADDSDLVFAVSRELPISRRPRVIVAKSPTGTATVLPPRGTAAIWLPMGASPDLRVTQLLLACVHDLPLHEAARATDRVMMAPAGPIRVYADPWTNNSIRMRDALINLHTEAERLELSLPAGSLDDFFDRVRERSDRQARHRITVIQRGLTSARGVGFSGSDSGAESRAGAARSYGDLIRIRQETGETLILPPNVETFHAESAGLVPMAGTRQRLRALVRDAVSASNSMRVVANDPEIQELFDKHQQRTVDVALQRLETSPLLSAVDSHTVLAAERNYRLRVHIGNPRPESLIVGERPPIDPLLPDPDDERGHTLEVAVQGKDFEIVSASSRLLHLPRFGSSEPTYFVVRTPRTTGAAALRVHIYHRAHIVQSYLLEARVDTAEAQAGESDVLRCSLTYSRVRQLADVDGLQPRALSISANSSTSGTHQLLLKGPETIAAEMTLEPFTFKSSVADFRRTLAQAARDPSNPKIGRTYPSLAPGAEPPKSVADTVRAFAEQGYQAYEAVFSKAARSNKKIRGELIGLKTTRDRKIQIVRHDDNFVFPWALLYDYRLPYRNVGDPAPPVCLGVTVDSAGNAGPCAHGPNDDAICVYGFWSVRHFVEEVLGEGVDADATVTRPAANAVRVVFDASLPESDAFEKQMRKISDSQLAVGPATEQTLLDLLWSEPPQRPSILVVVGHMETTVKKGEPASPRVVLVPASHWLTRKGLADRALGALGWEQPRPIVMLMACESAATSAETVNDFVTALSLAGAAAVIGTEAVVPADLAMKCACDVSSSLWGKQSLGQAMTGLRRRLLAQGNPLAFVFHALGNVDLTLN
jgi:hypothetical protein